MLNARPPLTTRRSFVGLTAAAFGSIALASCGGSADTEVDTASQNVGAMETFEADQQFTATEPLTVTMLWTDWPEQPVTESWQVFDHIKELTGVQLELTHVPFSDNVEKRSLLISAGDAPTLIPLIYRGDETPFVSSGAILPMSDYIEHMPNFRKYVEEWDLGELVENLKQADGKYYMLPGLQEVWVPSFSLIIRKDVWEKAGLGVPGTWEEVHEGLKAIKEEHPDSLPLADGFEGQSLINYGGYAFNTRAGWGFGDGMVGGHDGEALRYAATTDEYRSMIEYYRTLVSEGLLDPETLTAANDGSGAGGVAEKFAKETCFAASGSSGTLIEFAQALDETVGKGNYELQLIPPPAGPGGNIMGPRNFWHGFMLNSEIAESENFLAILQFLDWLYYAPQAREMLRWGIEGETYTAEGDTFTLAKDHSLDAFDLNVGAETDIQKDLGFSTFMAEATESRILKQSYNSAEYTEYIDGVLENLESMPPWAPAPLEEAELEQASLMATPLKDAVDTATLQFILGQRDLDEWEAFLAELEASGLQSYIDLVNGARDRFVEGS
ncbi:extracellular solute-binding protein [Brachybacterium sp.]|uniref:ABC transporter substrate-binding protein n=1 Tax=Brachybacterium sp. TaxID=1891286 RepID=UPI002ED34347